MTAVAIDRLSASTASLPRTIGLQSFISAGTMVRPQR